MGQLVLIENLEDGKTKITINRMPKTTNHYNILIKNGNICVIDKNIFGSESTNVKHFFDNDKQGRLHWHIHLPHNFEDVKYSVIFDNTQWVKENINDIISQLLNQEEQILVNNALKRQVKSLTQAIKTNDYLPLIKQMIIDNSTTLSTEDLKEIKTILNQLEQSHHNLSEDASLASENIEELIEQPKQAKSKYVTINNPSNARSKYWHIRADQVKGSDEGYIIKIEDRKLLAKLYNNSRPRFKVSGGKVDILWDKINRNIAYLKVIFDKFNFEHKLTWFSVEFIDENEEDAIFARDIYNQLNEQALQIEQKLAQYSTTKL